MKCCTYFFIATFLLLTPCANAQQLSREQISERLEKDGCVTLTEKNVKICKAYYLSDGNSIEALSIRPLAEGKYPGILLTQAPLTLSTILAQQGFACLSVEQPGFGKSQGKRDFVGPATVKALITGFKKLQSEPHVDSKKMGIFGYSRGAIAASLMALRLGNEVKAAVLGAGAYDFKKAYDEVTIEGIRKNMEVETGMTEKAIKERSSVLQMKKLKSPVLILHSEKDENVPVNQALLLRDRLTSLGKDFEIKLSPTGKHGFLDGDFISTVTEFFNRRLKGVSQTTDKRQCLRTRSELPSTTITLKSVPCVFVSHSALSPGNGRQFGFRAREAWRKHKAWGVSPRENANSYLAREAGGSGNKKDIVDET